MTTFAVLSFLVAFVLVSMVFGIIWAGVWAVGRIRRGEALLPPGPERTVPWGLGSVVLVILAWVGFNVGVSILYTSLTGDVSAGIRKLELAEVMLIVSLVNGGLLVTVPPLLRLTSGARLSDVGFEPTNLVRQGATGAVAFLLVSPFVYAFNGLAVLIFKNATPHALEEMVRTDRSEQIARLAVLSAVILAPAAEELIFRGVLQSWLYQLFRQTRHAEPTPSEPPLNDALDLQSPEAEPVEGIEFTPPVPVEPSPREHLIGPPWLRLERAEVLAIVVASALFAAVHLPQWPAPLAIFVLSLGLGLVYRRTGSLIAVIIMHAMFNGLGTLLLYWGLQHGDIHGKKAKPPAGYVVSGRHLGGLPQRVEAGRPR